MNNNEKKQKKEPSSALHKTLTIVGIVLCVILIPMLIANCTLIIKSIVNKDEVPNIGGITPLIVMSDSMYPEIKGGDIIIVKSVDPEDIEVGDVIAFFDPKGGTSVVTHRVEEIYVEEDVIYFKTKGDANNTGDKDDVPAANLVGEYTDIRIAGMGSVAMFMQTTPGLIVCVVVPLLLLIGYDMIRRKIYEKNNGKDVDALMAELEALKAEKAKQEAGGATEGATESTAEDTAEDITEAAAEPEVQSEPETEKPEE